jgi:hypothetical protein
VGILNWRGRTSKKAFTERFRAALAERLPDASLEELGELEFRFERPPDIGSRTVWLGRAYQEFCKNPANVKEILSRWLSNLTAPDAEQVDPDHIIPIVKGARWRTENEAAHPGGGFDPWTEPYNPELIVAFAQYHNGLRFPHRNDFHKIGIPLDDLRERAFANLRNVLKIQSIHGGEGGYLLGAGGTIDANLLLLGESTQDPRIELAGEPLVAVSDRDSFWIADDANPFAIFGVAARVARCHRSEPYPISKQLFHRVNGVWQPLDLVREDAGHPIPKLDVIDICGEKLTGGVDLIVIVASPLGADARSVFRLLSKLDGHLCEIESSEWKRRYPQASIATTSIIVKLHPDTDPVIAKVLNANAAWAEGRGARLIVEDLEIG